MKSLVNEFYLYFQFNSKFQYEYTRIYHLKFGSFCRTYTVSGLSVSNSTRHVCLYDMNS